MKNEKIQRAKGVRDFGPKEAIRRQGILEILKKNFEKFGFSPIETPIIERYDLFASKFGQGEQSEAMAETFKLKDQGGRDLVLRNEFTIPFARFVSMNANLKMPFKRYQIGQVFRDGPIKLGRYREFWQCDVDVVGVKEVSADVELIMLVQQIFADLGLDVEIQINNRKFINFILNKFGVQGGKKQAEVIISIDKLEKIGEKGVLVELQAKGFDSVEIKQILKILNTSGTNEQVIAQLVESVGNNDGLDEIRQTLNLLQNKKNVRFNPSLARGLAYYTGNVFEVFLKDKTKLGSALSGGGRYDDMISGFIKSKEPVPAVGISFGLETIMDALMAINKDEQQQTVTQVYVVPLGVELKKAMTIANEIRKQGIKVDIDLQNRKFKKNLEYANALNIPYVVIIGEEELKANKVTLKNMKSGKQELVSVKNLKSRLK